MKNIKLQFLIVMIITCLFLAGCSDRWLAGNGVNNKDIRSEAANTDAELEIGPDYLIEKTSIGKGVFLSEHLSETEVFIGQLLVKTVEDRGSIPEEKRQFFSDWAEEQLKQTNWEPLGEEWTADLYTYDRSYMLNYLYGDVVSGI